MVVPVLLILLAVASLSAWSSWTARTRLLARLRTEWGSPLARPRDMDAVSDFFRWHDASDASLDDGTWNDLLLDDVFAHLARAQSSVGQQMLSRRLRSAPQSLVAFDALIARAGDDPDRREQAQAALARLHD